MSARMRPEKKALGATAVRRGLLVLLLIAYLVLLVGGVAHHFLFGSLHPEQNWVASLFLVLAGTITLLTTRSRRDALWLLLVALLGFGFEVCGAATGYPFGAYRYTDVLQPQLFAVPVVMACAWMVLVAAAKQLLLATGFPAWVQVIVGALWMVAADLVIDPLAAGALNYWRWARPGAYYGVPVSNFAGWFVTSLLVFSLLTAAQRWQKNPWARWLGWSILLFFTLIALAHQLFFASLIGFLLCLMQALIPAVRKRR